MPPLASSRLLLLACDEMGGDPEDEGETGDALGEGPQGAHGLPEIARRFSSTWATALQTDTVRC